MPSVSVKLYSVFFKALLKHRLLSLRAKDDGHSPSCKPKHSVPANASFVDGVASKDIYIDHVTSLCVRIFLPDCVLPEDSGNTGLFGHLQKDIKVSESKDSANVNKASEVRQSSCDGNYGYTRQSRRNSWNGEMLRKNARQGEEYLSGSNQDDIQQMHMERNLPGDRIFDESPFFGHDLSSHRKSFPQSGSAHYRGYLPDFMIDVHKKLPIIIQLHGGGFVTGGKDSVGNDLFCRRMAKLCVAIVVAVGYRLAPEHKYPAAFDDGYAALTWLAHQANLAEYNKSLGPDSCQGYPDLYKCGLRGLSDPFGSHAVVDPWLAAHGDTSRCVLLGVSSGANIADFVARKAMQAGRVLEPVKIVAQVLMYPFFIGSIPTYSEIKLANSYFYDRSTCILAWKMLFSEEEYNLDHPVANPLVSGRCPSLKHMPPTLTVVGELDWMKDRAIAYSESLRRANLDAPVLEYKDAVHEFATLDFLVKSKEAVACAEDMAIWIKKYISQRGHEFSY